MAPRSTRRLASLVAALGLPLVGGASGATVAHGVPLQGSAAVKLRLDTVASGLVEPVDVAAPLDDGRLFVVERAGRVRVVDNGRLVKEPFADLKGFVKAASIEQGLLGIAFHPRYPEDRRVFLFHARRDNDTQLVSYLVAPDGLRIDPASRTELLRIPKNGAVRHNAGALKFAPDGLLYVSVGDAAAASKNGQNPRTLPGSILRIDVNPKPGVTTAYEIPADNPFADGVNGAPEVWWFGLRNPWRFSIDAASGLAYIGDVGQETIEEVDVVKFDAPGLNFGWPLFQATKRFYSGTPATPVVAPVIEVFHDERDKGCSITGGEVYRGAAIPELDGHYFYADWCNGWIRSFRFDGTAAVDRRDWSAQLKGSTVSAFGHDAKRELLVVNYGKGSVSRVVAVR